MGIISKIKGLFTKTKPPEAAPVQPKPSHATTTGRFVQRTASVLGLMNARRTYNYKRTTTASRRAEAIANARYLHVSRPITSGDRQFVNIFGLRRWLRARKGSGVTYRKAQANG